MRMWRGEPPLPPVIGGEAEPGGDGVALECEAAVGGAEGRAVGDGAAEGAPLLTDFGVYAAFAASLSSHSASFCSRAEPSSSRIFMSRERSLDALRYCATRWLCVLRRVVSTAVDDLVAAGVSFVESESTSDLEPQQPIGWKRRAAVNKCCSWGPKPEGGSSGARWEVLAFSFADSRENVLPQRRMDHCHGSSADVLNKREDLVGLRY